MAHLREQLGDERFAALVNLGNTGKVKEFCDDLLMSTIPTEMTIEGRTYGILGFLRGDEKSVSDSTMVERIKQMTAHLGQDDGEHVLKHQNQIPVALRGKVVFVFTDWRHPDVFEHVYCVCWYRGRWVQDFFWLSSGWCDSARVLRRK